jgi:hypothetical protein
MNLIEQIKSFFYYGWHMRKTFEFDATSIYKLLYLKLDRMYKEFENNGHCLWNDNESTNEMKKLRTARELAKRLDEDKYFNNNIKELEKKWGKIEKQKVLEKEQLFKLLNQYINAWWD